MNSLEGDRQLSGGKTASDALNLWAPKPFPISWHLIAMVLAVLVPAVTISGWLVARQIDNAREKIERNAQARADVLALATDNVVTGLLATLKALATSPALARKDYATFYEQTRMSLEGTGVDVVIRDKTLSPLGKANAALPADLATRGDDQIAFAALASNTAKFTDLPISGEVAGISAWIRIDVSKSTPLVLQARIPPSFLSQAVDTNDGENIWVSTIADRNNRIIAHSKDFERYFGKTLSADIIAASANRAGQAGVIRAKGLLGTPLLQAYTHNKSTGWRVSTHAPVEIVEQEMNRDWNRFIGIALTLGTLAIGVTSLLANQLSKSVSQLSANASALATGAVHLPLSTSISEIRDLNDVLVETTSELARRKSELAESDYRLRMALDAGGMGVWEWDRATDTMTWDPVQFDLTGIRRGERAPSVQEFIANVHSEDRQLITDSLAKLSADVPAFSIEFRYNRPDGSTRWLAGKGSMVADEEGRPRRVVGVNFDITAQKESTEHTSELLREVSHRSKNMLALILAMSRLTARDATDVRSHVQDFSLRVAGLAASQDLIVAADWRDIDLRELAQSEIKAIAHDGIKRVNIEGPDISVDPQVAQTLGMAFAELTLNAMSHGALSAASGEIDLTWQIEPNDTFSMSWTERGGPACPETTPHGYGMAVVERFVGQGLKASSTINFATDGVRWNLTAPMANIGKLAASKN